MNTYKVYCVGGVNFTVNADYFGVAPKLDASTLTGSVSMDWIVFMKNEDPIRYLYGPNVISIEIIPEMSAEKSTKLKQAERITKDMPRRRKSITDGFA